jgi:hypothetical protein
MYKKGKYFSNDEPIDPSELRQWDEVHTDFIKHRDTDKRKLSEEEKIRYYDMMDYFMKYPKEGRKHLRIKKLSKKTKVKRCKCK